jgi:hypothetical protein
MSIIPMFWPITGAQKRLVAAQLQLSRDRIRNAIEVWRGDLAGEKFLLDGEEITTWRGVPAEPAMPTDLPVLGIIGETMPSI